jgi:DNA-binding protein H-NS
MSMKRYDLKSMSTHQLSILYDKISATLTERIVAEKRVLEDRLKQLNRRAPLDERTSETPRRRAYPTVLPKFRNPDNMSETWAGRGKKPRWLSAQLKSGKQIEDFRIDF